MGGRKVRPENKRFNKSEGLSLYVKKQPFSLSITALDADGSVLFRMRNVPLQRGVKAFGEFLENKIG